MHGISCHLFGRGVKGEESESEVGSLRQWPSLQVLLVFNGGAIALTDQEVPCEVQLCRPETTLMLMLLPLGKGAERKSNSARTNFSFLQLSSLPPSVPPTGIEPNQKAADQ